MLQNICGGIALFQLARLVAYGQCQLHYILPGTAVYAPMPFVTHICIHGIYVLGHLLYLPDINDADVVVAHHGEDSV